MIVIETLSAVFSLPARVKKLQIEYSESILLYRFGATESWDEELIRRTREEEVAAAAREAGGAENPDPGEKKSFAAFTIRN